MAMRRQLLDRVGIPLRYRSAKLADFAEPAIQQELAHVQIAEGYFLHGPAGTGKTHLACAALLYWIGQGRATKRQEYGSDDVSALFVRVPDLLMDIRHTFSSKREGMTEHGLITRHRDVTALVLDDLGAEKHSEWTFAALYAIIAARYDNLRPTIVTSNMTLDEIHAWEPRIASRLATLHVIEMAGTDRRVT